ncbi:MAG: hypothetical protein FH748_03585 [Balneolaceae bacterium]|nr:hypothetical protein [Balneolaceae bacterium]
MNTRPAMAIWMVLFVLIFTACTQTKDSIYQNIPSLDDMPGEWVSADTVDMEPSIRNFRGQALTNRDINSVSWFASAPYSGGYHTGRLRINGETPEVSDFRWQAWQALRKVEWKQWKLESSTRMPISKDGVMWEITITNQSNEERALDLELDMIGFISNYENEEWQWWYPYPKMDGQTTTRDEEVENVRKYFNEDFTSIETVATELVGGKPQQVKKTLRWSSDEEILQSDKYSSSMNGQVVLVQDQETSAQTVFRIADSGWDYELFNSGAVARKSIKLEARQSYTLRYLMLTGDDHAQLISNAEQQAANFSSEFKRIEEEWKSRWEQIFRPENELLSGAFPVLETEDSLAKRVYYTGPLTMLYLMNTNLPQHEKVFITGGPRWGGIHYFFLGYHRVVYVVGGG